MRTLLLLLLTYGSAASEPIAIENVTVWISPTEKRNGATVLIEGPVIRRVGNGAIPATAIRIDGTGKTITAGLIDVSSRIGLAEIGAVKDSNEGVFGKGRSVFASYRTADGFNQNSIRIPIIRSTGVTSVISSPRGAFVSGQSGWFDTASIGKVVVSPSVAMHAVLGNSALPHAHQSRGLALLKLRELLMDAQFYKKRRSAIERGQARKLSASPADLEALNNVLDRKIPLIIHAHRQSDIEGAIRIADDFKLRIAIAGANEAWRVVDQLAKRKIPVLLDPGQNLPRSFDRMLVREDNGAYLAKRGVPVMISTLQDYPFGGILRQLAGIAIARGLPYDKALASVTTVPASFFEMTNRGEIKAGNIANLVLWSGDPFELSSQVEMVIIQGQLQPQKNRHDQLFQRYRQLK